MGVNDHSNQENKQSGQEELCSENNEDNSAVPDQTPQSTDDVSHDRHDEEEISNHSSLGPRVAAHVRNLSHGMQQLDGTRRSGSPLELDDQINRVQSQVTITTGTSDELSSMMNQPATLTTSKMAPTTQRPASANFATQQ